MRTRYRIDSYQKTYFVIDSFEQLMEVTAPAFTPIYARLARQDSIPAGVVLDGDKVFHRGRGEGWPSDADVSEEAGSLRSSQGCRETASTMLPHAGLPRCAPP